MAGLRRRIELATELRSVTGTMKSLAAVSIHQYEHAVYALEAYVHTIELGLQVVLRNRPELALEPRQPITERTMMIVFGSARGLCGPLNRHVAAEAGTLVGLLRSLSEQLGGDAATPSPARWGDRSIVACGERVVAELEALGLDPGVVVDAPASVDAIGDRVEELLAAIDRWRAGGPGRVFLVQPRPRSGERQYEPAVVPLLPLDSARWRELSAEPWPTRMLPAWRAPLRDVFAGLTRQLLFAGLHRALAETQVCAHRARLAVTQGAEESIGQRLDELSVRFHRQRQAAITGELLDVISGFEAAAG